VRAGREDHTVVPDEAEDARTLGSDPSPLAMLEDRYPLFEMDRGGIGTPLGDLEALSPH
jgi:hypothetical protein